MPEDMLLSSQYSPVLRYPFLLLFVSLIVYLTLIWVRRNCTVKGLKSLPSPPRNVIGGHEGQADFRSLFLAFEKWAHKLGPVFQIKLGPQTIISVNDPRMAKEMFEKRGSKYSGRMSPHVAYDLLSQRRRIIMTPNGPMHTAFRRQIHGILSISRTKHNHSIQELESRQVLHDILEFSSEISAHLPDYSKPQSILRRYSLSVMMTLSFGHRLSNLHDPIVRTVFNVMEDIAQEAMPGQYLVDSFPVMKKLPYFMRTWEHKARRKVEWQWAFLEDLLQRSEAQMKLNIPNPGLIRSLLEERQGLNDEERNEKFLDDKSIAYQSMTLMEAGADTTAITAVNFLLAMVLHPEVMKRGQASVDASVPAGRLPSFDDLPSMPYINQIVKEVMRWRPAIVMGVPHVNTTADEVNGFYIPANSVIFGNMWAMQRDPARFDSPEDFVPERFEKSKAKSAFQSSIETDAMDRDHYIFGWGRRICPGMHLAEASMLLLVARILWAFDVTLAKDAMGNDIKVSADPETAYHTTIIANPKVFPVSFTLRNEERRRTIETQYNEAVGIWSGDLDLFRHA